jgi:hypothetical protein
MKQSQSDEERRLKKESIGGKRSRRKARRYQGYHSLLHIDPSYYSISVSDDDNSTHACIYVGKMSCVSWKGARKRGSLFCFGRSLPSCQINRGNNQIERKKGVKGDDQRVCICEFMRVSRLLAIGNEKETEKAGIVRWWEPNNEMNHPFQNGTSHFLT